MSFIHHIQCPVCSSSGISEKFRAKDHTVSKKEFAIWECSECSLRFTQDIPDIASIGPYYKSEEYISHTNSSKGLINSLYQAVRRRTLKKKRKLVQQTTGLGTGILLDAGSGTGAFANEMHLHGWNVTGVEPDADARSVAKQQYNLELKDASHLNGLKENSFDAITMWHVLEHVHELHDYIDKLKALLKDKGRLIIAVPNYNAADAEIYKEEWAAYDVPRHLYHFSPASMKRLMELHGLTILEYRPLWYDSFYISMLSSKYKKGRTELFSSFFNGLRSNFNAIGDVKKCSSVIYVISRQT